SHLALVSAELAELGPVNHRAAQEYRQERERHDALQLEIEQAEAAAAELAAVLERLDQETNERLERALGGVVHSFRGYVNELFGAGAEADIEVERAAGRPAGLRIGLQPPGKQTRQLNLLSVGERTMGA